MVLWWKITSHLTTLIICHVGIPKYDFAVAPNGIMTILHFTKTHPAILDLHMVMSSIVAEGHG
jgi:hypothetical protein